MEATGAYPFHLAHGRSMSLKVASDIHVTVKGRDQRSQDHDPSEQIEVMPS